MDTTNKYIVGAAGKDIVIMNPPSRLSKEDALMFAAWIVALADMSGEQFEKALEAVWST